MDSAEGIIGEPWAISKGLSKFEPREVSLKGKNIVSGPGLVKSLKRVWKAKPRAEGFGCFDVSGGLGESSTTAPLRVPTVLEVAQKLLPVIGNSPGDASVTLLSLEVEDGEIVDHDAEMVVVSEVHLLDPIPLLLKPLHPVDFLHPEMNNSSVSVFSGDLQQEFSFRGCG